MLSMERRFHCVASPEGYSWRAQGWGPQPQIAFLRALNAAEDYIENYNALSGPIEKWKFETWDRESEIEMIFMTNHYHLTRRFTGRF